jgi:hypothetical protein
MRKFGSRSDVFIFVCIYLSFGSYKWYVVVIIIFIAQICVLAVKWLGVELVNSVSIINGFLKSILMNKNGEAILSIIIS